MLDKLLDLPNYLEYVPEPESAKSKIIYALYGRPALMYDTFNAGDKDIDYAINILREIEGGDNWHSLQVTIMIVAITYFCIHTVYMGVNITCYSVRWCREECFCNRRCCFVSNKIIYASISLVCGLASLILNSLAMAY